MKTDSDEVGLIVLAILAYASFLAVYWFVSFPDVYVSWAEQECVRVIDSHGQSQPCDPLPRRYHLVWVR